MNVTADSLVALGVLGALSLGALLLLAVELRHTLAWRRRLRRDLAQLDVDAGRAASVEAGPVTLAGRLRGGREDGVALRLHVRYRADTEGPAMLGHAVLWRRQDHAVEAGDLSLVLDGSGERVTVVAGGAVRLHARLSRRRRSGGSHSAERTATLRDGDHVFITGTIVRRTADADGAGAGYRASSGQGERVVSGAAGQPLTIFTQDAFRLAPLRRRAGALSFLAGRLAAALTVVALLASGAMAWGGVEAEGRVTAVQTYNANMGRGGRKTAMTVEVAPAGIRCDDLPTTGDQQRGAPVVVRYVPWWPAQCALAGPFRFYTDLSWFLALLAGTVELVALLFHALEGGLRRPPAAEPPYAHRWSEDDEEGWRLSPLD